MPLCVNNSHVTPMTAVVIKKMLSSICQYKDSWILFALLTMLIIFGFFMYFHSSPVLVCEPVIDDLGQTEHRTAKKLLL